jgi:hypothetical protein
MHGVQNLSITIFMNLLATFRLAVLIGAVNTKELVMLRGLFAGLRNGFGWLFNLFAGFISWPFRMFSGGGGRSSPGPDITTLRAAEKSLDAARGKDSVVQHFVILI